MVYPGKVIVGCPMDGKDVVITGRTKICVSCYGMFDVYRNSQHARKSASIPDGECEHELWACFLRGWCVRYLCIMLGFNRHPLALYGENSKGFRSIIGLSSSWTVVKDLTIYQLMFSVRNVGIKRLPDTKSISFCYSVIVQT